MIPLLYSIMTVFKACVFGEKLDIGQSESLREEDVTQKHQMLLYLLPDGRGVKFVLEV